MKPKTVAKHQLKQLEILRSIRDLSSKKPVPKHQKLKNGMVAHVYGLLESGDTIVINSDLQIQTPFQILTNSKSILRTEAISVYLSNEQAKFAKKSHFHIVQTLQLTNPMCATWRITWQKLYWIYRKIKNKRRREWYLILHMQIVDKLKN